MSGWLPGIVIVNSLNPASTQVFTLCPLCTHSYQGSGMQAVPPTKRACDLRPNHFVLSRTHLMYDELPPCTGRPSTSHSSYGWCFFTNSVSCGTRA